eukprot:1263520-Pyramimonas_sp.AAC.1
MASADEDAPVVEVREQVEKVRATQQFISTVPEEPPATLGGEPLHGAIALLSFFGVVETGYLTVLKLTQSAPALCSSGSGSCESVLSSKYSEIFNIPLPVLGMLAYGSIFALAALGAVASEFSMAMLTDGRHCF